jgi:hypothetical protein
MRAVAFGEYYNTRSFAHSMDPRFKITIAAVALVAALIGIRAAGL